MHQNCGFSFIRKILGLSDFLFLSLQLPRFDKFLFQVVAIMGSLTTCDPGDIHNTIQACKTANVRCSVISLAAEVRVYKKLAKDTDGVFSVILDDVHLRDLLQV